LMKFQPLLSFYKQKSQTQNCYYRGYKPSNF